MNDVKKCPHCAKQLHSNAQYCMYCMTSLQPKQDITPGVRKGHAWVFICILLVLLVILSVLIIFVAEGFREIPEGETLPAESQLTETREFDTTGNTESTQDTSDSVTTDALPTEATETSETNPNKQIGSNEKPQNQVITTESNPTEPAEVTQPQKTEPTEGSQSPEIIPTTKPDPTEAVCSHYYLPATCIAPLTCIHCGETKGSVNSQGHNWDAVTSVIHHDEVGHYDEVEVSYKKTVYLCYFCGYNQEGFDSIAAVREHFPIHSHYSTYETIAASLESRTETRQVWATKTERQWVVDQKAYDETVIDEYVCKLCNARKDP